ncbi:MAG: serine hydrolase [Saprospiraceae bacterium]|nr:serine hydrolase [Saprospiraceae bacterium]
MKTKLLLLALFAAVQLSAQNLYFPPNNGQWATISPTNLNWCSAEMDSLQRFLEDKNTKGFIILKDGKIAVEWYFDGFTQDSLWYWASAGKSLTATLVGIAQEEGHFNINDLTSQYLGNWTSCSVADEQQITIKNQLSMTTGLDDNVADIYCTDDTCLHCLAAANTRWAYHNAPYTLLDEVLTNATGVGLNVYLYTKINLKIGTNIVYVPVGYNTVAFSKTRDLARFGLLTLAKGNWNGTAVYSDTSYYNAMTNSSQNLNPAYGYLWWLNGKSQYMLPSTQFVFPGKLVPNAPNDMFSALGKNDQKIYVVPSENMVVIRIGNSAQASHLALSSFDNDLWGKIGDLNCATSTAIIEHKKTNLTIFQIQPTELFVLMILNQLIMFKLFQI